MRAPGRAHAPDEEPGHPLTTKVTAKSRSPSSSATTDKVVPGFRVLVGDDGGHRVARLEKRATICGLLPMTMVTAIVSPSARPRARITAPEMPARPYGKTTCQIVSHFVAPRASEPSRCICGTADSTSRETAAMKGSTMMARINPRQHPQPVEGPEKSGRKPRVARSAGAILRGPEARARTGPIEP